MGIPVYSPAFTVTLTKLVARQDGTAARYTAADREVDLTPFFGEAGSIRTSKTLYEPAGSFELVMADQIDRSHPPKAVDQWIAACRSSSETCVFQAASEGAGDGSQTGSGVPLAVFCTVSTSMLGAGCAATSQIAAIASDWL